jgi:hypothetical protein
MEMTNNGNGKQWKWQTMEIANNGNETASAFFLKYLLAAWS